MKINRENIHRQTDTPFFFLCIRYLPSLLPSQWILNQTAGQCPDYPSFAPAELPYELYTHLNFAFVMINDDGVVEMQHPEDEALYKELNALKLKKPSLKTTLTVGMHYLSSPPPSLSFFL